MLQILCSEKYFENCLWKVKLKTKPMIYFPQFAWNMAQIIFQSLTKIVKNQESMMILATWTLYHKLILMLVSNFIATTGHLFRAYLNVN